VSDQVEPQLVEVRGLEKRYGATIALDSVDLNIPGGHVLGLVGRNGAGKSTLIKVLVGVTDPDAGEILVRGEPVNFSSSQEALEAGIVAVHQELAVVPELSVAENMFLGLRYPRVAGFVRRGELRRQSRELLDRLSIDLDPNAEMARLDPVRQRLAMIARGLAANASVLILDEPTASLTDDDIGHLHATIRTLRDSGVTVVYVSHRLDEIFAISNDVAVMRDGRLTHRAPITEMTHARLVEQITGEIADAKTDRRPPVPAADREETVRVEKVSFKTAVKEVSLSLNSSEIVGIAGLVGAGRTELVRLIAGAEKPSSGEIFVRGKRRRFSQPADGKKLGIVLLPEDRRHQGTIQEFSIRENITLASMSKYRVSPALPFPRRGSEREEGREMVDRLSIKAAGLEQPVGLLSGGNQQKVVLAKWLAAGADVLIFDEPTQGIDVRGKNDVYEVMLDLARKGNSVLFISSEFSELVQVCNRVLVMREGQLVGEVSGDEVTESALVEMCYGTADAAAVAAMAAKE
jgi:ABC-type sugar transport system ATPase subunit